MRLGLCFLAMLLALSLPWCVKTASAGGQVKVNGQPGVQFHTSDRCMACHNGMTTGNGRDISIANDWRASIMGNSSRDPYWQGSLRRETIDHPSVSLDIQDECSTCHMPVTRYEAKLKGQKGEAFKFFPFNKTNDKAAIDGVTCSVCHQIAPEGLGTKRTFSGNFVIGAPKSNSDHPEYGPYRVDAAHQLVMQSSTGGFVPTQGMQIQSSALCASCHTLYTTARGESGKETGVLPEQMPFLEWEHSSMTAQRCQDCHMLGVAGDAPISSVLPVARGGVRQHVFVGGNFFMQRVLNQYRNELDTGAPPRELSTAADLTAWFLQTYSAKVTIKNLDVSGSTLNLDVQVENLAGHKLPTAFPSRRAWLWVKVTDHDGKTVFESGKLNPDGSIQGNDNDADKTKYERYYREITSPEQVEIYEDILGDPQNHVTTGLLEATHYLKDSRLLPKGFDKATAVHDIAVVGEAANAPNFTAGGDLVRYAVSLGNAQGPFHVQAELWYQPIGFRWAHNLEPYQAEEDQRFVTIYNAMSQTTGLKLAGAEATR